MGFLEDIVSAPFRSHLYHMFNNQLLTLTLNMIDQTVWPGAGNPANHLCVVDLLSLDDNMVMNHKKCILNYHNIDDPWYVKLDKDLIIIICIH